MDMSARVEIIASSLLRSNSLKFGLFKLKSGIISPYYIDLTWLLSSPEDFKAIVDIVADEIRNLSSRMRIDCLASIELKGALLLPSIAERVGKPCLIVRKESKAYGLTGRIAGGYVKRGEHILFFDDVITDGRSKIEGIKPLEDLGARVETVLVVIDREQGGRENMKKMGYNLISIVKISEIIEILRRLGKIPEEKAEEILKYIKIHQQG